MLYEEYDMKGLFWVMLRFIMVLVVIVLFGTVVMMLWNWLLPPIAGLSTTITFFQAVGLLALSRILFGGLGGMGRMAAGGAMHDRKHINPFREKWGKMSKEEQREFIRKQHFFTIPLTIFVKIPLLSRTKTGNRLKPACRRSLQPTHLKPTVNE
jgi:hypothetical protein